MEYIKKLPEQPSFTQNGLNGYSFDMSNENISMAMVDVYKGHEKYCKGLVSTYIYYVLSGSGTFKISEEKYKVNSGDVIEIPPNINFVYEGKMKLLLIMNPAFNPQNEIKGKDNDLYEFGSSL